MTKTPGPQQDPTCPCSQQRPVRLRGLARCAHNQRATGSNPNDSTALNPASLNLWMKASGK